MGAPKLDIIVGKVVDVQLTERTIIEEPAVIRPNGRRGPRNARKQSGVITGRLRVFVDGPDLKDPHYDFENCELAVHKDQMVAIARHQRRKKDAPLNVLLRNLSAETECVFSEGLAAITPNPWFGPRWKAFGLSLAMLAAGYALSRFVISQDQNPMWWVWWPLLFAVLAFPVFWGVMILVDGWIRSAARKRTLDYVHAEIAAATSSPETAPDQAPESAGERAAG